MEDNASGVSISPRGPAFLQWFTWKKCLIILLGLSLGLFVLYCAQILLFLLAMYSIFSRDTIQIQNRSKGAMYIQHVALDGRRLVDEQGMGGHGFRPSGEKYELGELFYWNLYPQGMRSNATHRITVRVSSASDPSAKDYSCAIFIPPKWGEVYIFIEDQDKIRCKFREH